MLSITHGIVNCTSQTEDEEMIGTRVVRCVLRGPLSTAAFEKKKLKEIQQIKNVNWQEADQLMTYMRNRGVELGTT